MPAPRRRDARARDGGATWDGRGSGGRLGGTWDGRAMHRHATGKGEATRFDGEKTQQKALLFVLASGHPILARKEVNKSVITLFFFTKASSD